jgi:hypothetical protein
MTDARCVRCGWPLGTTVALYADVADAKERAAALERAGYAEDARQIREEAERRTRARLERQLCDVCACPVCRA